MSIEKVCKDDSLLAIIIRESFEENGITFVTPRNFSQQMAYMKHPRGKIIEAHSHRSVPRAVEYTQEVLFVRNGKLRVDFYDLEESYLESRILGPGDVILLASGGHGFEVLEEVEMVEVKQGPYLGEKLDKKRFENSSGHVKIILRGDH